MNVTSRSYLTAGVAALSVGAIALTPIQPIPNNLLQAPERAVSNLTVNLAAAIDPITPWAEAISAAAENAYNLQNTWWADPFPIASQIVQNQLTYFSEFPNVGLIVQQVLGNIPKFIKAPFVKNPDNINSDPVPGASPAFVSQRFIYDTLTGLAPSLAPVLDLLTSPISGFLLGFAGPGLSSMLQLRDTIQNILKPPPGANWLLNAINETINLPANLFNAAFNGGKYLDLTNLVKKLAGPTLAPAINAAGLRTGGFLNAGGVAFDGIAANATLGLTVNDPGLSVGFIGATGTLATAVANAIKVVPPPPTASVKAAAATSETPAVVDNSAVTEVTAPQALTSGQADENPAPARRTRRGASAASGDSAPQASASQRARRAG